MKHTLQIVKNISLAAVLASACLLFGCTRADVATTQQGSSTSGQSAEQGADSVSSSGGTLAGGAAKAVSPQSSGKTDPQSVSGKTQPAQTGSSASSSAGASSAAQSAGTQLQAGTAAQTVSGTTTQSSGYAQDKTSGQSSLQQTGQTGAQSAVQADGQVQDQSAAQGSGQSPASSAASPLSSEQAASQTADGMPSQPQTGGTLQQTQRSVSETGARQSASGAFSGEFTKSEGDEMVAISLLGGSDISFQFLSSGIGGAAVADGGTAVYTGDDGYSVTFSVSGDQLNVSVSGEGGSASPVNGTYYRVVDGGESSEDQDDDYADEEEDDDVVMADAN